MPEIEAKFYVLDLKKIETRIQSLGADLIQPRILETNIRFDLPDGRLRSKGRVLRLRHDTEARLTYKGPGRSERGVIHRDEIEFIVENFEKAKLFLEVLEYQKLFEYEKYRTTYVLASGRLPLQGRKSAFSSRTLRDHDDASELRGCHIMLDELPYGNFVEIEAEDSQIVHDVTEKLKLDSSAAIPNSYSGLFDIVRRNLSLNFNDLTFANFHGSIVTPEHLSVQAADR